MSDLASLCRHKSLGVSRAILLVIIYTSCTVVVDTAQCRFLFALVKKIYLGLQLVQFYIVSQFEDAGLTARNQIIYHAVQVYAQITSTG